MPFLELRTHGRSFGLEKTWNIDKVAPPTEQQKKRRRFGTMFMLHALMNNAGIDHENKHTLICSGYVKTKERF